MVEDLKVRELTLKNYRTFFGEKNPIVFSTDKQKPVTIFHGTNARGKTTLLNSIHWCIYGKEKNDLDQKKKTSEGLVHSYAIDSLRLGDEDEMFVNITMEDENSDLVYQLERKIKFKKISDDDTIIWNDVIKAKIPKSIEAETEVTFAYRDIDTNELIRKNDEISITDLLENIFPKILSSYLLFDAELLQEFEKDNADKLIKEGIETITGLPILHNALKHLSTENKKIATSSSEEKSSFIRLQNNLQRVLDAIEEGEKKIERSEEEVEKIQTELQNIVEYLIKHDDDAISQKEERIKHLETTQSDLQLKVIQSKSIMKRILFGNLPHLFLQKSYEITSQKFDKWGKAGLMPTYFNKQSLQHLLDNKLCVCTRTLGDEDDEFRKKIEDKIEKSYDSAMSTELGNISQKLNEFLDISNTQNSKSLFHEFSKAETDLSEYRQKISDLKSNIKKLKDDYDPNLHDTITAKQQKRTRLERERSNLESEISREKNKINLLIPKKDELESDYKKAKKQNIKDVIAQNKILLADFAEKIISNSSTELFQNFKKDVENETQRYFLKIAPQASEFKGVKIDDDNFTITAERQKDKEKTISQGQAHALGLSYISGIRSVMKKNYFLMIDSPFHNISQEAKLLACRDIPKHLGSTQITFFVTNTEYRGKIEEDEFGQEIGSARDMLTKENLLGLEYNLVDQQLGEINGEKYRNTNVVKIGGS